MERRYWTVEKMRADLDAFERQHGIGSEEHRRLYCADEQAAVERLEPGSQPGEAGFDAFVWVATLDAWERHQLGRDRRSTPERPDRTNPPSHAVESEGSEER